MKKIFGSILHIISLLSIIIALFNFLLSFLAYKKNNCTGSCFYVILDTKGPLITGIVFILITILTFYVGKYLKK